MKHMILVALVSMMMAILLSNCATTDPIDMSLSSLVFNKENVYVLDTSQLKETEPPNFIFLVQDSSGNYKEASLGENPDLVALEQSELVKIDSLVTLKNAYKDIAKGQGHLINIEREKINAVKEMMVLERESRQIERNLRLDAERSYRLERRDHKIDNIISRATLIFTVVGGIAIAAL